MERHETRRGVRLLLHNPQTATPFLYSPEQLVRSCAISPSRDSFVIQRLHNKAPLLGRHLAQWQVMTYFGGEPQQGKESLSGTGLPAMEMTVKSRSEGRQAGNGRTLMPQDRWSLFRMADCMLEVILE
jgi:hypothetical protein